MFSLKTRNENEQKTSITVNISQFNHKKKKYHRQLRQHGSRIHLKFNNKVIIFLSLFKDLAYMEMNRDHDVISYLRHTVVTTAEPPPHPCSNRYLTLL